MKMYSTTPRPMPTKDRLKIAGGMGYEFLDQLKKLCEDGEIASLKHVMRATITNIEGLLPKMDKLSDGLDPFSDEDHVKE